MQVDMNKYFVQNLEFQLTVCLQTFFFLEKVRLKYNLFIMSFFVLVTIDANATEGKKNLIPHFMIYLTEKLGATVQQNSKDAHSYHLTWFNISLKNEIKNHRISKKFIFLSKWRFKYLPTLMAIFTNWRMNLHICSDWTIFHTKYFYQKKFL